MSTKRKITESVPSELFEAVHNLLAAQGFEKSASSLIKEAGLDKKKAASNGINLVELFNSSKSNKVSKSAPVKSSSSSDSSSDSSSSDDEKPSSIVAAKVVAKPVAVKKQSSSSSSDSSSSSEDEAPKKIVANTTPSASKSVKKASSSSSSSSDSSSSDSSEDEAPKKVPTKPVATAKAVVKKAESSSSSSSESDSSDDEAPPKKVAKKSETATPVKTAVVENDGKEHKIYVKGLPWLASEAEVRDFFKGCGTIVSTECPMGEDGRSSGTAFVKFSKRSELEAAVALDGQLWPGTERWLKIQEGVDKPNRNSFGGGEVGVRPEGCDTVFVGNLPWDVSEEQMREIFSAAGEISSVRFATGEDGGFRGFGHVSFYDGDNVDEAVKLAGTQLNGRAIRVDFAPPRNREAGGGRGGRGDGGRGRGDGGRGRGDGGRGRGGRGGTPTGPASKSKGSIAVSAGKKMTFDE